MAYNSNVPTPFHHLGIAEAVLASQHLDQAVRAQLRAARPAFLLGSTAPDISTINGQPRETTHFFAMPMVVRQPAHVRLLEAYPHLQFPSRLDLDLAAFMSGYLAHLWLDQCWIANIFEQVYGPDVQRDTFRQRLLDHNLLRAHLDAEHRLGLPEDVGAALRQAEPAGWLDLTEDNTLRRWRDHLSLQLQPGTRPLTTTVFARRHGIHTEDFESRLASQSELQRAVYRNLPHRRLRAFDRLGIHVTTLLLNTFLSDRLADTQFLKRPFPRRAARTTPVALEPVCES